MTVAPENPGLRRQRLGWISYDFANSTYHLMLPTILMPILFRQYFGRDLSRPDLAWAITVSTPIVLAGILGPLIGAFADRTRKRTVTLASCAGLSILLTAALAIVPGTATIASALVFAASYLAFLLSLGLYDSLLPHVATSGRQGTLSGLAWGLGYLGGLLAVGLSYPLLRRAQLPHDHQAYRLAIVITAALYLVFTSVSLLWLRRIEKQRQSQRSAAPVPTVPFLESAKVVWGTLKEWRKRRQVFGTLVSYYLASDGLATMTYFTAIYATATLGFASRDVLVLFLIVQAVGLPASIVGGVLADRVGFRPVLYVCLALWSALSFGFFCGGSVRQFYVLSVLTGLVMGTTPAVYRALLASQIVPEESAEIFGFNSFASRASSVLGPLVFAVVASASGSQRPAMLSLVPFFVAAAAVLAFVPFKTPVPSTRAFGTAETRHDLP